MVEEEPSLNIPSLLTLAVVSYFVIRWFFKRDGDNATSGSRGRTRGNVVDPAQVEQISQMFPQLSTREIMWDLQRNGGNVAATTERVLSGRGLDAPPPSFQPLVAIPPTGVPATQPVPSSTPKSDGQDLITRYNLSAKVAEASGAEPAAQASSGGGWSQNKEERQRLLQKRRDDMILAARRKMEQKQQEIAGAQ
ncbi:CUE domain-containing protein [Aspergillus undulatus]|uniref:CUE domain-containing protein n=1 Tax=Aspergillus undulatus TaxID=1810928 RepID=UPI003CCD0140